MANQRLIYGFHAVNARLWQNPKSITELYIQEGRNDARTRDVLEKAAAENVRVHFADAARLDAISKGARHQGVAGFIDASKNHVHLEDVLENLSEPPLLLVLDGITDPHNLGAIIRSAECVGAHGVIVPERRAVGLTPAAVKASAGAIEHIKVARVVNMTRVIEMLKARNIWTYALTMDGTDYEKVNFKGGVALVVGSEGEGISHLVLENCDQKVSLPMAGHLDSLNASVAAGVVMYRVLSSRRA